jgi:multidrug efflux pump subunit AcrA (membrane-fusion protein)
MRVARSITRSITKSIVACGVVFGLLTLGGASGEPQDVRPSSTRGASTSPASHPGQVQLRQCLVSLIHDVEVPAREAGVLMKIAVREGQEVKLDQELAQIDD